LRLVIGEGLNWSTYAEDTDALHDKKLHTIWGETAPMPLRNIRKMTSRGYMPENKKEENENIMHKITNTQA